MARADRLERLEARRVELEAEYTVALVAALQNTAAGTWGLFGHQQDRAAQARAEPILVELADLADTIDAAREQLLMEPFALHREFLASRGKVASNAVGEPKQARAWLDRMGLA
jgi:hypothetical protein